MTAARIPRWPITSSLPWEHAFATRLNSDELMQSASVAWVSTSAFFSELMQMYTNMVENQPSSELLDKVSLLEKQLKLAEMERDQAFKQRDTAVVEVEQAETTMNFLKTALEEEKNKHFEEEQSSNEAIDKAGSSAVEAFSTSEAFMCDLGELTLPSFKFDYISTIQDAAPHLTSEQLDLLKDKDNYNEDAKDLCDHIVEGIQAGKNLTKVREEFNSEMANFEPNPEGSGVGEETGTGEGEGLAEMRGF